MNSPRGTPEAPVLRMVADDLTGALDAAAGMTRTFGPLRVGWDDPAATSHLDVISTDTRDRDAEAAAARSRALGSWLSGGGIAYKKIDSQLRGHVGAELAACLSVGDFERVVIAPAFPAQRRITRGGTQWLRGNEREPWQTAGPPIVEMLTAFGLKAQTAAAGASCSSGITVFDAETDSELEAIVRGAMASGERVLWCGSAGLAGALAECLAPRPNDPDPKNSPHSVTPNHLPSPMLMILGTVRPLTLRQITEVETRHPGLRLRLSEQDPMPAALLERLQGGRSSVVTIDLPHGYDEARAARTSRRVLQSCLASIRRAGVTPGSLFVSGGQTLMTVAELSDCAHLIVEGAFEPGVPVGRWCGGLFDGVGLAAKSGGFGGTAILSDLVEACDPGLRPQSLRNYERS